MDALLTRWNALSNRERILLSLAAVLIATYIIYSFIWRPLDLAVEKRVERVQKRIDFYSALESRVEAAKTSIVDNSGKKKLNSFSGNAMVTVEETIKEYGLSTNLSLASPSGNSVSVWFTNIEFDDWLKWVDTMRGKGLIVTEARVSAAKDKPGIVNVKSLVTPIQ